MANNSVFQWNNQSLFHPFKWNSYIYYFYQYTTTLSRNIYKYCSYERSLEPHNRFDLHNWSEYLEMQNQNQRTDIWHDYRQQEYWETIHHNRSIVYSESVSWVQPSEPHL